jgi:hypothetical protein
MTTTQRGKPAAAKANRKAAPKAAREAAPKAGPRWVQNVKTVSTFPPAGLFTQDAHTVAQAMASKEVSPKGIGSGIKMIQYFINRAGKGLSAKRRRELEKAKQILQDLNRKSPEA